MSAPGWWIRPQRPAARMGLKGPDAPRLLAEAGIAVPRAPNTISQAATASLAGLSRCLRLGNTEFLLEQDAGSDALDRLRTAAKSAGLRAWCVVRADYSAVVGGAAPFERLARIASFDFEQLLHTPDQVVMTLAAEISVTMALDSADPAAPQLRLWADSSFGGYLEQTLHSLSNNPSPHASAHALAHGEHA